MNPDLFTYILDKFKEDKANQLKEKASKLDKERYNSKLANIENFIEFARKLVKDNPPSAFDHTAPGYGVVLRNGDRVSFLPTDPNEYTESFRMYGDEVAVTRTNRSSDMQPSTYIKI